MSSKADKQVEQADTRVLWAVDARGRGGAVSVGATCYY